MGIDELQSLSSSTGSRARGTDSIRSAMILANRPRIECPHQMTKLPEPGTLTPKRLVRLVAAGETESVEFKGRRTRLDDIATAAVCLANGPGGLILYGVADDGTIDGTNISNPDSVPRHVYHKTSPSQVVRHQVVDIDDARVIAVWVRHSQRLVSTTGGGYVERIGTECVPMTPDRLIVRQIDTGTLDISSALTPVPPGDVDVGELERYRQLLPDGAAPELRRLSDGDLLRTIGAVALDEGTERLTVAGVLMFCPEEVIRAVIPQHRALYLRTPQGTTDYDRRVTSAAPILRLMEEMTREVQAAGRVRMLRLGMRDLELPDYPERVLREAIVNAVAHRHYTLPGDIVIRQTAGYLAIENPGGFPEGITVDTVIQHAPVHRNRLLCDILERIRFMERSGLGVDRIFEDQLRYGKPPPTFEADRTRVRLRLDASEFDEPFARFVLAEEEGGRNWRVEDLLIVSHLRRMGPSDRSTLAAVIQRPETDTQDIVTPLLDSLLGRFGSGPGTRYALNAQVQRLLGAEAAFTRERGLAKEYQRGLVLQHAREFGRIDNRTVRELLQVSVGAASRLLRTLEARGDLIRRGAKRWAHYEPAGTANHSS